MTNKDRLRLYKIYFKM